MTVNSKIIVLDCETTGIKSNDEILQLSIINGESLILFNELIKPVKKKKWNEAAKIHKIYPCDVEDKPTFSHYKERIQQIIDDTDIIVGYNINFDLSFLKREGIVIDERIGIVDLMKQVSSIFGEWVPAYNDYKYQKLTNCADYDDYDWQQDKAHDSLCDVNATLYCYRKIQERENRCRGN